MDAFIAVMLLFSIAGENAIVNAFCALLKIFLSEK
jgi:hypothetical protein